MNFLVAEILCALLTKQYLYFQILIVLWMTRSITDDIPGWGSLFNGRAGDGTVSVSICKSLTINSLNHNDNIH